MDNDQLPSEENSTRLAVLVLDRRLSELNSLDSPSQSFDLQTALVLNELRTNGQLCDAVLRIPDGTEFLVHRVILSVNSCFFRALFTNGLNDTSYRIIDIRGVDSVTMKLIIQWVYTRNLDINEGNVESLLAAADQFQIATLMAKCCEFLEKSLSSENAIGIWKFAACYFCKPLRESARVFLMSNFLQVVNSSREFLELSVNELVEIVEDDELDIIHESHLFLALMKWVDHRPDARRKHVCQLVRQLRLGQMSRNFFFNQLRVHPYIRDCEECRPLLVENLKYIYEAESQKSKDVIEFNRMRSKPRVSHRLLMAVGGWTSGLPTSLIEIYDPRAGLWQLFELVDRVIYLAPRAYHGCLTLGTYMYTIGGFDGTDFFNSCRRFDLIKKEWQEIAPMNAKRCYVSVASLDGVIYAMGGFDGSVRQYTAEKYVPERNQWSFIAKMHANRSDASAASLDGKIYICGGFNGLECIDSAEFYDPKTNVWTLIRPMQSRRSGIGVVACNGCIYAIGGYNGTNRLSSCEKFNVKTREWSSIPSMISPRSNFGIEVLEDKIFAIGGYDGNATIQSVESYSDQENVWKQRDKMNLNRSALSVCVMDDIRVTRQYSVLRTQLSLFQSIKFNLYNGLKKI